MKEKREKLAKFITDTLHSLTGINGMYTGGFVYGIKDIDHKAKMLAYSLNGWLIPKELQAITNHEDPMTEIYKVGQKRDKDDISYIR